MARANCGRKLAGYHHDDGIELLTTSTVVHELSTGEPEYHAQYERSSGWVWTGGLEARQGVGTQDWGSPYTTLKQNSKSEFHPTPSSELGLNTLISERP